MTTEEDGQLCLEYLQKHPRIEFTLTTLTTALGLPNSKGGRRRARRAILWARDNTEGIDGHWFIPDAVPAENFVYRLTNKGVDAVASAMHAHRRALGARRRTREHDDFMAADTHGMSHAQQMELEARRKYAKAQREMDESVNMRTAAIERDREIRKLKKRLEDGK